MSTSTRFKDFCDSLQISPTTSSNVMYRYKRMTSQMNLDFWQIDSNTRHSLLVGSYGRDTAINVSDVDTLMWLPYKYYESYSNYFGNGQSALIQALRTSIKKTYSTTHVKGDGQVVVVAFDDSVRFEIVPCFENKDDSFTYPDTNDGGSWKTTDPRSEIKAIADMNFATNYNLKRLCRMMRTWKIERNVPMSGILLDTLAYKFIITWKYSDKSYAYYDWMVRDFLLYLKNQDENQTYWFAPGSNKFVYSSGYFQYKALVSYNIALQACEYESKEQFYSAGQKWKEIFGVAV